MLCVPNQNPTSLLRQNGKVDISLLLKPDGEDSPPGSSRSASLPAAAPGPLNAGPLTSGPVKRPQPPFTAESPAKKQSKWSAEEDALIIRLRGEGMKWEDISKHLPGRSAISCRLHYQNYLERRSEWDEDRKNKLARLYERFKPEMWAKVAEEMSIPWRAAEAMHWQLGEQEMAKRAGVQPFSLSNTTPAERNSKSSTRFVQSFRGPPPGPPPHQRPGSNELSQMSMGGMPSSQLPSMAELTANIPAYAPQPPQLPQDPYAQRSPQLYRSTTDPRR
ncbi:putative myb dna-binding domain protein [Phaeomoniella chlamydospora]|uniref:Putative myb dna-binding domain protein n=1 Tax=Phaeomoniella chlamydospora TaxID=158046 RepID=A0A0G2F3K4_PHACM|nr:putative myb dna-binding domain protein [Phaeomoniella chlamydospora]